MYFPYDLTKPLFMGCTLLAAWTSGNIAQGSIASIGLFLRAPNDRIALTQWNRMYDLGKSHNPKVALVSMLCALGAAYTHYHPQAPYRTYWLIASGLFTMGIAPWTLLVMIPTNNALFAHVKACTDEPTTRGEQKTEEVQQLLKTWRLLNGIRSIFPFVGALCAFEAL